MPKAADLLQPEDDGAFTSFMRFIDRPGQVVRNLLKGNFEGAGRQAVDFLGDIADAPLPGNWIPHISRPEDDVSGADLINVDKKEHPVLGFLADLGVGTLTDPVTYIPGGLALKGLKGAGGAAAKAGLGAVEKVAGEAAAGAVAGAADSVLNGARKAALATKDTLGWLTPKDPEIAQRVTAATDLANLHMRAGSDEIKRVVGGLSPDEDKTVWQVIQGVYEDENGARKAIPNGPMAQRAGEIVPIDQQLLSLKQRATQHPGFQALDPDGQQRVLDAIDGSIRLAHKQFLADVKHGALAHPKMYADEAGNRFHRDELEEMIRQQQQGADEFGRAAGSRTADMADLKGDVGILDDQTALANKLANQSSAPFRGTFSSQARRDRTLLGKQDATADALDTLQRKHEAIDPGEFDAFVKGRGLGVQPVDISNASPRDYMMRSLIDDAEDPLIPTRGSPLSAAKPTKSRSIQTPEDLANAMNAGEVDFDQSALSSLAKRNDQQGRMLKQAQIAKGTLGDHFTSLVDPAADQSVQGAMRDAINAMDKTDPEGARVLLNAFQGPGPRGPLMETLAKANRLFKPAAVYGVVVPKVGSIVRNAIGGTWQTLSTQGAKAALQQARRTPEALLGAFDEAIVKGFGLSRVPAGALSKDIGAVDEAFRAARGDGDAVAGILRSGGREDLAQAVQHGVLDGFVSSERIIDDIARAQSKKQKWWNLYDMPGTAFQGVESRMRLGNYLDQLKRGVDPQTAAQQIRDTFLDYSVTSGKNRTLRDLIPFAAFTAGSVKQQAKFLGKNPAAAVALSQALLAADDHEHPLMPYQQGRLNIPIGNDSEGNDEYISGIGLPFEALNSIPNPSADLRAFGRQIERSVVGQSHPLLKSAFGVVSGDDPNFGTEYGSYSKLPGNFDAGGVGRAYNKLAGTGLIQPLDTLVRGAGALVDDRHSLGTKAVDLLTGANVVSVDPAEAERRQIMEWLSSHPDVATHRSLYSRSHDPQIKAMIRAAQAPKR